MRETTYYVKPRLPQVRERSPASIRRTTGPGCFQSVSWGRSPTCPWSVYICASIWEEMEWGGPPWAAAGPLAGLFFCGARPRVVLRRLDQPELLAIPRGNLGAQAAHPDDHRGPALQFDGVAPLGIPFLEGAVGNGAVQLTGQRQQESQSVIADFGPLQNEFPGGAQHLRVDHPQDAVGIG